MPSTKRCLKQTIVAATWEGKSSSSRKPILISNKGFLLIEGLLATAIITLVGYFALSLNNYFNKSLASESSKVIQNFENIEFTKRITEPVYFGSLARYEQNLQLKKCLSNDENLCDTSQVYPFQAFDLATDQPMSFASKDSLGKVRTDTFFKVHCADAQTTCDKAEYFTVIVKTYVYNEQDEQISFVEKSDIVAPQFNNVFTYVPSGEISPGRPINVVIYLDNSGSMLGVKDKVKAALDDLLDKLSGLDVRVGLYNLYDLTQNSARVVLDQYYLDASNQKQPLPTPLPDNFEWYKLTGFQAAYLFLFQDIWGFGAFSSFFKVYDFKATDSYEVRSYKLNYLMQLADYYFDNAWAGAIDTPFCSILRMLEAPSSTPVFSYDSFTPNIVYIITNEDDETRLDAGYLNRGGCPQSELLKMQRLKTQENYYYKGDFQYMRLDVNANFSFDGALVNQNFEFSLSLDKYLSSLVPWADCKAYAESIGDYVEHGLYVEARSKNLNYTKGSGYVINSCKYYITSWTVAQSQSMISGYCDSMNNGARPTPFYVRDPDLFPSYISNTCTENYMASQVQEGWTTESISPLGAVAGVPNSDTATLVYEAIKRNADLKNFYYVPIIHPDDTACGPLIDGARVGTKYLDLAKKPGMNSTVIPVCSSDFSGPLNSIVSWTSSIGINDLEISSFVAANFGSVELIRSGSTIQLTMGVDYDLIGTTIQFKPGTVSPNDTIKVYTK